MPAQSQAVVKSLRWVELNTSGAEKNTFPFAVNSYAHAAAETIEQQQEEIERLKDFARHVIRDYTECDKLYIHIQNLNMSEEE